MTAGNPALVPFMWSGALLFPVGDNRQGHCTAQFITDRVLLTAAHCVQDQLTGRFHDPDNKQTVFLSQFQNDQWSDLYRPVCSGVWPNWVVHPKPGEDTDKPRTLSDATKAALTNSWQWDYSMILVDHPSRVGHFNYDLKNLWDTSSAIGYPAAIMDASVIQFVHGEVFESKNLAVSGSPNVNVLWHGNTKFTGGASGGAWIVNRSRDVAPDKNVVVGLVSFHQESKPGATFGPRFTTDFDTMLKFVSGGCRRGG